MNHRFVAKGEQVLDLSSSNHKPIKPSYKVRFKIPIKPSYKDLKPYLRFKVRSKFLILAICFAFVITKGDRRRTEGSSANPYLMA